MPATFTDHDLEAYLDESLDVHDMALLEAALRAESALLERLKTIQRRRDLGGHSLAAVWRRHRLSCPTRENLGSFLLDTLPPELRDYVYFHVTEIGCRMCQANLRDLEERQQASPGGSEQRRRRYFQTSAGLLPESRDE